MAERLQVGLMKLRRHEQLVSSFDLISRDMYFSVIRQLSLPTIKLLTPETHIKIKLTNTQKLILFKLI